MTPRDKPATPAPRAMQMLEERTMSPQKFLEISRRLPLRQRPQAWWDLLSILGGATAGGLWLLYGSVRATRMGPWFTLLLLLPVILVVVKRRRAAELASAAWKRMQKLSTAQKVLAAAVPVVVYMQLPKREGLDLLSPLFMVAIPLGLVWFRKEIDQVLSPLQPLRAVLPLPVRVGIGMAIPFATAYFLYNWMQISQYPLMQTNTVVGTLLSYAIIRQPAAASRGGDRIPRNVAVLLIIALVFGLASPLSADDFLRDPFNLNDGLRTPGWAPVIAGVSTAVVTLLVNGVEVVRTVIQARSPVEDGEQPERKNFQVIVNTVDKLGATSTTVSRETGGVTIKAHCEQAGGRFPAGDSTIVFSLMSGEPWVTLSDVGTQGGERCAQVTLADPQPESGNPPESCDVHVSAGSDGLIGTTISLKVEVNDFELEFS